MFQALDATIKNLLSAAPAEVTPLHSADVSFLTPEKSYRPATPTVNLFLYRVKENRELRDPAPMYEPSGNRFERRPPPLRVDCAYLVTAWGEGAPGEETTVSEEHKLLGQAFWWLHRFSTIPDTYFAADFTGQVYPPPVMIAEMDGGKPEEFWYALGIAPRPSFNLVVTMSMDLDLSVEGPLATTLATTYQQRGNAATREEWIQIGGTVRDGGGQTLANAWVRMETPDGAPLQTTSTSAAGRFQFKRLHRGQYRLRAGATGRQEQQRDVDVPSASGEYDLVLT